MSRASTCRRSASASTISTCYSHTTSIASTATRPARREFHARGARAVAALRLAGQVREPKNLVEAIFVDFDGGRITLFDFLRRFATLAAAPDASFSERERLVKALFVTKWNKSKAAEELNWSRTTLYRKLAKDHVVRDGPFLKPWAGPPAVLNYRRHNCLACHR